MISINVIAVQGIEVGDYVRHVRRLYEVGYRHFAIGGLAKRTTDFIDKLVGELMNMARELRDIERMHFLGITRLSVIPRLMSLIEHVEEASFDSSTVLRINELGSVGAKLLIANGLTARLRHVTSITKALNNAGNSIKTLDEWLKA